MSTMETPEQPMIEDAEMRAPVETPERGAIEADEMRVFDAMVRRLTPTDWDSNLIYTPTSGHSYYRDFFAEFGKGESPGGHERLMRHGEQMDKLNEIRTQAAERAMRAGQIEYRVEPNRTQGQGGYFSPPAWLNQLYASIPRPGRVLSALMTTFDLPDQVGSVNLPVMNTGTIVVPQADGAPVAEGDITDMAASSSVVYMSGAADVALQLLELSPHTAALDWVLFTDLQAATSADLEYQLIMGPGGSGPSGQLLGLINFAGSITYTDSSPTGSEMYPYLGQTFAKVSNTRKDQPQCFLMRGGRWAWIRTSEDANGLPFDIGGVNYLGSTADTPDPIGGLVGLPTFLSEAIPTTVNATVNNNVTTYNLGGNQDMIIAARPTEMLLLEGAMKQMVAQEPMSGTAGVRIRANTPIAALTARRPEGVAILSGTGMAVPSGF